KFFAMFIKRLFSLLIVVLFIQSCKKPTSEFESDFSFYQDYISSFTSGLVSAHSDIRVEFTFYKLEWEKGQELLKNLIDISPYISGKVVALLKNTIAFLPSEKLNENTEYRISLKLVNLIQIPKELADFRFTIKTFQQDFVVQ